MQTRWDQSQVQRAWNFAAHVHQQQTMPGSDISYLNHLGNVMLEAMAVLSVSPDIKHPNLLIIGAILHDTIEDTDETIDSIEAAFGTQIAQGVDALSKRTTCGSKREQMLDSLKRIQQQPDEVAMIKLCDRITNLQAPPAHWSQEKIAYYLQESQLILDTLGYAHSGAAERLQHKIAVYPVP